MRLPDIESDSWELRSGEAAHQAHPDTFWIPLLEARQNLKRGQAAKLIFDIEAEDEHGDIMVHGERIQTQIIPLDHLPGIQPAARAERRRRSARMASAQKGKYI